jgi:hypothetical protein
MRRRHEENICYSKSEKQLVSGIESRIRWKVSTVLDVHIDPIANVLVYVQRCPLPEISSAQSSEYKGVVWTPTHHDPRSHLLSSHSRMTPEHGGQHNRPRHAEVAAANARFARRVGSRPADRADRVSGPTGARRPWRGARGRPRRAGTGGRARRRRRGAAVCGRRRCRGSGTASTPASRTPPLRPPHAQSESEPGTRPHGAHTSRRHGARPTRAVCPRVRARVRSAQVVVMT